MPPYPRGCKSAYLPAPLLVLSSIIAMLAGRQDPDKTEQTIDC